MAASVEGTATCSPALQTLSLMQARHTISPPYFNQRLSTCQQWENNLRKRIIALAWVRDPFVCTANKLSIDMQEPLIELKSDSRLKELFSSCPLSSFWAALMQEYPELCDVALKILLPFTSTYLCKAGFSKMTALKTKYRNRAQIEDDLRLCLSNIEPIIEDLCKAKQAQVSHYHHLPASFCKKMQMMPTIRPCNNNNNKA